MQAVEVGAAALVGIAVGKVEGLAVLVQAPDGTMLGAAMVLGSG